MNKHEAIKINYYQAIEDYLVANHIVHKCVNQCTELGAHIIFIQQLTPDQKMDLLKLLPDFYQDPNKQYHGNFACYYDNGQKEIIVKNNEYKLYDTEHLYGAYSGKYELTEL